jgi:hypothetical protein
MSNHWVIIIIKANAIINKETGNLLEYRHLVKKPKYRDIWSTSYGNKIGQVFQGMPGRVKGTNTAFFIHKHDIPADHRRDVTYGRIVTSHQTGKARPNQTGPDWHLVVIAISTMSQPTAGKTLPMAKLSPRIEPARLNPTKPNLPWVAT